MQFRKLMMVCARQLASGKEPDAVRGAQRYQERAGASLGRKSKDLATVMMERFGDPAG